MRKCPKCGTILDDTKKKCYMCGSDIQLKPQIDFMNGFDDQIGATVTKSQDNVFNSVPDISVKVQEVIEKSNNSATFTSGSTSADFFKNEMNNLNSMQYDERTAIEKIFSNDSRFRSKDEINAEEAMKKNKKGSVEDNPFFSADDLVTNKKNNKSTPVEIMPNLPLSNQNNFEQPHQNVVMPQTQQIPVVVPHPIVAAPPIQQVEQQSQPKVKKKKEKTKKDKPAINWGNNLSKGSGGNPLSLFKDKFSNKTNLSPSFIFNTICFVLFASALIFMYFKFRSDPSKNGDILIGDLSYTINSKFKLKNDHRTTKLYHYGDRCTIRVSYGIPEDSIDFIDNYFKNVQNEYTSEKGYINQMNEMKINGNEWSEITVAKLEENPASNGGYGLTAKFRFVTILYKNNYYEIRYVNSDDDNTCSAMYDELIESLEFVER